MVVLATNLGFPRIGPHRELKSSLEAYWAGKSSDSDLQASAAEVREHAWRLHAELGVDHIPSGDFSLYDHVLDTAVLVGAIPERYQGAGRSTHSIVTLRWREAAFSAGRASRHWR